MRPLQPGDDHNLLANRSKGDPHPQYRQLLNTTFSSFTISTSNGSMLFSIIEDPDDPGSYVLALQSPEQLPVLIYGSPLHVRMGDNPLVWRFIDSLGNTVLLMNAGDPPTLFLYCDLIVTGAINPGTTIAPTAGAIRYSGTDLEGYVGGVWKSLTTGAGTGYYEPLTNGDPTTPELVFDSGGDVVMVSRGS